MRWAANTSWSDADYEIGEAYELERVNDGDHADH